MTSPSLFIGWQSTTTTLQFLLSVSITFAASFQSLGSTLQDDIRIAYPHFPFNTGGGSET